MSSYFDYAAATPMAPEVLEAMQPFFSTNFYNPSADYEPARRVRASLESARTKVAQIIGAKPVEVIFVAGGTEANNLAIHGVMRDFDGANMVISAIEHDSVRRPSSHYNVRECAVNERGLLDLDRLESLIDENTVLVSVMQANNEIGTIQPIREVAGKLEEIRKKRVKDGNSLPLYLHVDAAQSGNYLDIHVHRLGIDLMTLNGGKIYGPKQSGVLYVRSGISLAPIIEGGGQERSLRSGTENVAACVGFATALSIAQERKPEEIERLKVLQKYFIEGLKQKLPELCVNGSLKARLPNNVHVTIPGQDNERLLILLDQAGIHAASGSACSASHDEPSHVLAALGLDDSAIRASLRFSMGRDTRQADIDLTIETLVQIVNNRV